ncbi:hypothetical protein [Oligoflexus tunisiensis]|uniref:hypothetical protein n=1 Tax=Oligoflexus tunisiensis TaxID=708132 RepID=UPI00114CE779|nr:hypothetical protein [Oligoflexus tunisiensis]
MKAVHFLLVGTLLPSALLSCKSKLPPPWSVRAVISGPSCADKDGHYKFGVHKLECTENKSKSTGPVLSQDFTHCYVSFQDKPFAEVSTFGVHETCEVSFEGKTHVFSGYTGEKAIMTQGETAVELTCIESRSVNERSDVDNCQEYLKIHFD